MSYTIANETTYCCDCTYDSALCSEHVLDQSRPPAYLINIAKLLSKVDVAFWLEYFGVKESYKHMMTSTKYEISADSLLLGRSYLKKWTI